MDLSSLTPGQWALAVIAALLVGCSKTGLPGIGVLQVPLFAAAFPAKLSVGALLPLLIVGDIFAVCWYRRHAQWEQLWRLFPWVVPGLILGGLVLWLVEGWAFAGLAGDGLFKMLIGLVVLVMLVIMLVQRRLGSSFAPKHPILVGGTGAGAGFATTLANAAGPIMTLYLAGMRFSKEQFMGTNAWFFLILNLVKVPIFITVSLLRPAQPMMTTTTLVLDLILAPLVIVGVFIGRWLLPRISQRVFYATVLALAAVAAGNLLLGPILG